MRKKRLKTHGRLLSGDLIRLDNDIVYEVRHRHASNQGVNLLNLGTLERINLAFINEKLAKFGFE